MTLAAVQNSPNSCPDLQSGAPDFGLALLQCVRLLSFPWVAEAWTSDDRRKEK